MGCCILMLGHYSKGEERKKKTGNKQKYQPLRTVSPPPGKCPLCQVTSPAMSNIMSLSPLFLPLLLPWREKKKRGDDRGINHHVLQTCFYCLLPPSSSSHLFM